MRLRGELKADIREALEVLVATAVASAIAFGGYLAEEADRIQALRRRILDALEDL